MLEKINKLFKKHGQIPQGLKALGIEGRRDCDKRFEMYKLDSILKKNMNVLELGSNCGFLSCLIAERVMNVTGIEMDPILVEVANEAKRVLNIPNVNFKKMKFEDYSISSDKFDFVLSCQMHMWVKLPFVIYIGKVCSKISDGGYLLFESHDLQTIDKNIHQKLEIIMSKKMKLIHSGHWVENPGQYWIPPKNHKKIPRNFYIFQK